MSLRSSPQTGCETWSPPVSGAALQRSVPAWEPPARQLLCDAAGHIRLLGWATPLNWREELDRLGHDWQHGRERLPRFVHARAERAGALAARLAAAERALAHRGPLGELYARRAGELRLEQTMTEMVGTARFRELAERRYGARDRFDEAANRLAEQWLGVAATSSAPRPFVLSDDERCPLSLLRRLCAEVTTHHLPHRVVRAPELAALAATGPSVIYVATGRPLSRSDVSRTVLHEIHGHALPRHRAARARLGIFALGTAHGSDDQEGRALCLEDRAGWLGESRRVELALRHLAARSVEDGADFVQTARQLARYPVALGDRLRITARVHRGGGLGRERVYLPAYLRIDDALRTDPSIDEVLQTGAVAVDAAPSLRRWVP